MQRVQKRHTVKIADTYSGVLMFPADAYELSSCFRPIKAGKTSNGDADYNQQLADLGAQW